MSDERCTLMLSSMMCLAFSFVLPALPAYAGHGKIIETDTHIYVEYYGDDKDVQAGKIMREEALRKEEAAVKANAHIAVNENRQKLPAKSEAETENAGKKSSLVLVAVCMVILNVTLLNFV